MMYGEVQYKRSEEVYREIAGTPVGQYVPAHSRFGPDVSFFALNGIRAERLNFVAGRHVQIKRTETCVTVVILRGPGGGGEMYPTAFRGHECGHFRESVRRLSRGRCALGKKPKHGPGETRTQRTIYNSGARARRRRPSRRNKRPPPLVKRVINVYEARLPNSRPETPSRTAFGRKGGGGAMTGRRYGYTCPPVAPKNGGRGRNFKFSTPIRIGVLVRKARTPRPFLSRFHWQQRDGLHALNTFQK